MAGYSRGLVSAVLALAIFATAVVAPAYGAPQAQGGGVADIVADDANAPALPKESGAPVREYL